MGKSLSKLSRIVRLYAYQLALFADMARVVVALWCRQAGKDFATACKAVSQALQTGQDWYIISVTQRQADATFAKCRNVAQLYKKILKLKAAIKYDEREFVEYDRWIDQHFRCTARTLRLPGGGSVTALPGRDPDTLAGLTGNIIFTEFGLFPNGGYDHWRVVFPLATRGYQVIIISTPRGRNTKLYELVGDPETYSVHVVDIHRAVADGMPLTDNQGRPCTIEAFRRIYNDEIGWQREYLCQFTGDLEALVKWAQLENCSADDWHVQVLRVEGEAGWASGFFSGHPLHAKATRLEWGWDVARTGNLSALWGNAGGGFGARKPLMYLALMHKTSFALQRQIVTEAMEAAPRNVGCGDATGLGMDSNETLQTRYGQRWEPVTFTASAKRDMASGLATSFDDGEAQLPSIRGEHKYIHTDLYALQCDRSGGQLKLAESPNPLLANSHCDLAWAGALARRAAGLAGTIPALWVA